ncbi:hypothetical protein Har1130_11140 [Haloarcula sp. CBA1130]|uniref:hypothetical protein n=1 Tax=unclassified Haloarcula TaxID=2624677 RepID=UPI001243BF8E|nr:MULTISPECIES: hypothetical protein [unclassified Haloarcula]KAA9398760.1 hypothetical protein Har1129_11235 [Haloarcula sp. CBA1129]KAA9403275.1 hypothetical protein Har1130_11140 [Haloarcula sp. CBA1130]
MTATEFVGRLRRRTPALSNTRQTVYSTLFGDRLGLTVFLATVVLFGLLWRTAFLITDSYTLANGLYSLSNGQLAMTEAVYSPGLDTPGANRYGGQRFARNYGVIVLSLPVVFVLDLFTAVVELRIALVALWSLALLALVVQCSYYADNGWVLYGGSVAVLGLFGLNVALAQPLDAGRIHLYALQLTHLLIAAFAPVFLYRLLSRVQTRQLGLLSAIVLTAGTPLAFWATVPKRHVVTGTVVVCIAYCLCRSRMAADGPVITQRQTFRALAYALVGLYAWVHAPEALLLCVALALVDIPTAPDNSPRTLARIGVVFALSLLPFVITNVAISGSPVKPPRLISRGGSLGGDMASGAGGGESGGGSGGSGGPSDLLALFAPLFGIAESGMRPLLLLGGELGSGFKTLHQQPADVYHAFVRSGSASGALDNAGEESVNLSLLESAPVLVAMLGALPVVRRLRLPSSVADRILSADRVVDAFAITAFVGVVLLYSSRLPLHAQVTARYLFPLYPLGVYLCMRLPAVRKSLTDNQHLFLWTVAGTVLIGGQLTLAFAALTVNGTGEAFQLHALLGLGIAVPLGVWALSGRSKGVTGKAGAVLLGAATGVAAVFLLLTSVEYYALGDTHLLPMMRALGELLALY